MQINISVKLNIICKNLFEFIFIINVYLKEYSILYFYIYIN